MRRATLPMVLGLALLAPGAAQANWLKSLYSTVEPKTCAAQERPRGKAWTCAGLDDYPVFLAEDGLKTFVSMGAQAERAVAARQTLKAQNTIFRRGSERTTLEWRFLKRDGRVVPFATILRYFTVRGAQRGEVLVVTRVVGKDVCHVAYVDALANANAIALARQAADNVARKFRCGTPPMILGRRGQSPM